MHRIPYGILDQARIFKLKIPIQDIFGLSENFKIFKTFQEFDMSSGIFHLNVQYEFTWSTINNFRF